MSVSCLDCSDPQAHLCRVEPISASQNAINNTGHRSLTHAISLDPFHAQRQSSPLPSQGAKAWRLSNADKIAQPISSACPCSPAVLIEPDGSSEIGLPALSSAQEIIMRRHGHLFRQCTFRGHFLSTRHCARTEGDRDTPHKMNETHCLHFSSPCPPRGTRVPANAQMPSVDVNYCHQTTRAAPGTEPGLAHIRWPKSGLLAAQGPSPVPLFSFYHLPIATTCALPSYSLCLCPVWGEKPSKSGRSFTLLSLGRLRVMICRGAVNRLMF